MSHVKWERVRASAMILADDNFATIAAAGRGGPWHLRQPGRVRRMELAHARRQGLRTPPGRAVWHDAAGAALAASLGEPRDGAIGNDADLRAPRGPASCRGPRPARASILDRALGIRTAVVSPAVGSAAFGCFDWGQLQGLSDAASRTIAVNTIVVVEVGYLFACRSLSLPPWKIGLSTNPSVGLGAAGMLGTDSYG